MFVPGKSYSSGHSWFGPLGDILRRMRRQIRRRRASAGKISGTLERLEDRSLLSSVPGPLGHLGDIGGPGFVFNVNGYLTETSNRPAVDVARDYLAAHSADLGLTTQDLANLVVTRNYADSGPGADLTHITFQQTINGIPVFGSDINASVSEDGRLLSLGNRAINNLATRVVPGGPTVAAVDALRNAAGSLSLTFASALTQLSNDGGVQFRQVFAGSNVSRNDIPVELQYRLADDGRVHLTWNLSIQPTTSFDWWNMFVDAQTGTMLPSINWKEDGSPNPVPNSGRYNVLDIPNSDPVDGTRTIEVDPADAVASRFGWHDTNGIAGAEFTDTRGNNVFAEEDLAGDLGTTAGARPNGGASLTFDFPVNFTQAPTTYTPAATTNLFYLNNILHDVHYQYGFTEAAGNFQFNNYGLGGLAADPVNAYSQVFGNIGALDNAFMATPPDGLRPNMIMGLFDFTNPFRDTDFGNEVVFHEFGHGVSNRLTGNANGLNALQSGGMGEGWSDFWGLMFTQRPTDAQFDSFPVGNFIIGQGPTGGGIRRFPYSFDMNIDPLTYGSYNGDFFPQQNNSEVHNSGEIWCSVLWDLNWLLINKYGYDSDLYSGYSVTAPAGSPQAAGNKLALQLVMDGLKLQPIRPSFLDARDAILAADIALTTGENLLEIWTAFSRRGMGFSADDGGSANSLSVTEAFDVPRTRMGGVKFLDSNGNGLRNLPVDVGLAGWTIFLDQNQNGVRENATQSFTATGLPKPLRDATTTTSTISVSGQTGVVLDVNVTLNINHTFDADLEVFLVSPTGTRVELFTDVGENLDDFLNTTLDDSSGLSITASRAPFSGTFRPEGLLTDFISDNPNGDWALQITDDAPRDSGILNSWSLQINSGELFQVTDSSGAYTFDLPPRRDTYYVTEEQQLGWFQTTPVGSGTQPRLVRAFDTITDVDFGNQPSGNLTPILTFPNVAVTYLENSPPVRINSSARVVDGDSVNFFGGVLTAAIVANPTADDRLEIINQGVSPGQIGVSGGTVTLGGLAIGSFFGGAGASPLVVTLNNNATPARVTALLRAITFRVDGDTPQTVQRAVTVTVSDGAGHTSNAATVLIDVVAENDAPVNTVPSGTLPVLRNIPFFFTGANAVSIADPDAGNLPLLVTVAGTNGTLSFGSTVGLNFSIGDGTADPTMTFTGTQTDINAALAGLVYASNPGTIGPATVTITSNDQGATGTGGPRIDSDTINLAIGNLPPTLTSIGTLNGAVEDTDFAITYSALSLVANVTDPNFDPITFRIESVSSGTLQKNGVPVTPQGTFLGSGESVTWHPAANANGLLPAFTVRATDGVFFTDPPVQVTINVSPVPDAPTLTTISVLGTAAATFPFTILYDQLASAADEADVDNDPLVFRVESVTVTGGLLAKNGVPVLPGVTTVTNGETLVWTPVANAQGTLNAFTISAVDPTLLASSNSVATSTGSRADLRTTVNSSLLDASGVPQLVATTTGEIYVPLSSFTPIADGQTFTLSDGVNPVVTFEFDKTGAVTSGNVPVTFKPTDPAATIAASIVAAINGVPNRQVTAIATGNRVDLPGVRSLNTTGTPSLVTVFKDQINVPSVGGTALADGQVITFSDGANSNPPTTFEFNSTGGVVSGNVAIPFTAVDSANTIAASIAAAVNGVYIKPPASVKIATVISTPPTLTSVTSLSSADRNGFIDISYDLLKTSSNAFDPENDPLTFRVESVSSGALTKNGASIVPGVTTVGPGESLRHTPIVGTTGEVNAFTVTVTDNVFLTSNAVIFLPAAGGAGIGDGQTFILNDGINPATTFEFDASTGVVGGRVPVLFEPTDSANKIAESMATAINGVLSSLNTSATARVNLLNLATVINVDVAGSPSLSTAPGVNVRVNVVNTAPTLSTIGTLGVPGGSQFVPAAPEAFEDQAFTITQSAVRAMSNAADFNGDTVNFVIQSVLSGTVTQNGIPVVPGITVLDSANAVAWTPAPNANGVLGAFTVVATDGNLKSTNPIAVNVNVTPVNDVPTMSLVNTILDGIETLPYDFTHQILSAAADEADIDSPTISFRVDAVFGGTLLKNGVQVIQGVTTVGPNEKFVWIPPQGAIGLTPVFLVRATDGFLVSNTPLTVTLQISPLGLTRMYRSYNPNADYHFFTLSTGEFSGAVNHGYRDETSGRPGFAVPVLPLTGTSVIHRLRNPYNGRHYYTGSSSERDFLRNIGWVYEKDEGNIFNQQVSGSVEVFRLYNTRTGTHLFTENASTKNDILRAFPGVWVQHASLGFAFALPTAGTITSSNPGNASARSDVGASSRLVASAPPATARAQSASDSSVASNPSVFSAGMIAPPTGQGSKSIPMQPKTATTAVDEPTRNRLRNARAAQLSDPSTGLFDQVWTEVGQELILGGSRLIDSGD